jgi:hypothetical protein
MNKNSTTIRKCAQELKVSTAIVRAAFDSLIEGIMYISFAILKVNEHDLRQSCLKRARSILRANR